MTFLQSYLPTLIRRGLSNGDDPVKWTLDQLCRWVVWHIPPDEQSPGVLRMRSDGTPMPGAGGIPDYTEVGPRRLPLRPHRYDRWSVRQSTAWEHSDFDGHRDRLRLECGVQSEWSGPITAEHENALAAVLIARGVGEPDALYSLESKMQRCAVFWWSSQSFGKPHGGLRGRHWEGLPTWYFAKRQDGTTDEAKHCRDEFLYDRVEFRQWGWCELSRTAMYYSESRESYFVHVPFCVLKAECAQVPTSHQLASAMTNVPSTQENDP